MTATRLIAIQSLPEQVWIKYDLIVPFDWENDAIPATVEVQLGKMYNKTSAFTPKLAPVWAVIVRTTGASVLEPGLTIEKERENDGIRLLEFRPRYFSPDRPHHAACVVRRVFS